MILRDRVDLMMRIVVMMMKTKGRALMTIHPYKSMKRKKVQILQSMCASQFCDIFILS